MEQRLIVDTTLADRLRAIQAQRAATGEGPTQDEIGRLAGMSRGRISEIANLKVIPTPQQQAKLWEALNELGLADADEAREDGDGDVPGAIEVGAVPRATRATGYKRAVELYETNNSRTRWAGAITSGKSGRWAF